MGGMHNTSSVWGGGDGGLGAAVRVCVYLRAVSPRGVGCGVIIDLMVVF